MNARSSQAVKFKFRLHVAGDTANSVRAIANLAAICREHLLGRYEIEIVDVFKDSRRALADGVLLTPTLIKIAPAPVRRIVGTLADTQAVLYALGLDARDLAA